MPFLPPNYRNPLVTALALSLGYMGICGTYILISTQLAGQSSTSVSGLQRMEQVKGLLFILISSICFFIFSLSLFRKILLQKNELLHMKRVLMESEQRALSGIFASSVAHDINNILCMIDTEELQATLHPEDTKAAFICNRISRAYEILKGLSTKLHQIGNQKNFHEKVDFDISKLIQETVEFARIHSKVKRCTLNFSTQNQSIPFKGNPFIIQRALINLVLNAAEAAGEQGTIEISLNRQKDRITLEVSDSGPGIPEDQQDTIFSAFYTTKPTGSGLGLISVQACSEIHSGSIAIDTSALGGARFSIKLPQKS